MPDHVHLVMQPLWDTAGVARKINLSLQRHGSVWLDESHDHQIRTDESLLQKIEYTLQNPVRKGLIESYARYRWIFRSWIEGKRGRAEARPT